MWREFVQAKSSDKPLVSEGIVSWTRTRREHVASDESEINLLYVVLKNDAKFESQNTLKFVFFVKPFSYECGHQFLGL